MGDPTKTTPVMCPHGCNPIACPTCWRAAGAKAQVNGKPVQVTGGPTLATGAKPPEAFSTEKLWEPAAHPSVIDRLSRRS
jgi:hypothetical protein